MLSFEHRVLYAENLKNVEDIGKDQGTHQRGPGFHFFSQNVM